MFDLAGLPNEVIDQILDEVVELRRDAVLKATWIIQMYALRWKLRRGIQFREVLQWLSLTHDYQEDDESMWDAPAQWPGGVSLHLNVLK